MKIDVIVLAAGKGSRMKSKLPKVLQPLAGKPLLSHVLDTANTLENTAMHVVIGHCADQVQDYYADESVNWVSQTEQLGTGHAVQQALPAVDSDSISLILYGDVPLTTKATLEGLIKIANTGDVALLTVDLDKPTGYGRIIRDTNNAVQAIVEQKDANEEQLKISEVNTGILALKSSYLKEMLPNLSNNNAQGEYYLTDIISMSVEQGISVNALCIDDELQVRGVNDKKQLAGLERDYQSLIANELMEQGVTLIDPARLDVRGQLSCGQDVSIDVNCIFQGDVTLGDNVEISANCIIGVPGKSVSIAANTVINPNSIVEEASVGESCNIGPFARLRPGTILSNEVRIGNFVETKKSTIGLASKVNHLTYIGDSIIGQGVNVGAGTITCNYDGANKHQTHIEDNAFIGSNTAIVAPCTIGASATIAAGSTVTMNVETGDLAVARGKQKNIKDWVRPKKK